MGRLQVLKPDVDGTGLTTNIAEDGTAAVWDDDVDNKYPNSGKEWLLVKAVGATTMKLPSQARDPYGDLREAKEVAIVANTTELYGPYDAGEHNEREGADRGYTAVQFGDTTSIEVTVVRRA